MIGAVCESRRITLADGFNRGGIFDRFQLYSVAAFPIFDIFLMGEVHISELEASSVSRYQ